MYKCHKCGKVSRTTGGLHLSQYEPIERNGSRLAWAHVCHKCKEGLYLVSQEDLREIAETGKLSFKPG